MPFLCVCVWRQRQYHSRAHKTFASHAPPTPTEAESAAFPVPWDFSRLQSTALHFHRILSRDGVRVCVTFEGGAKQDCSSFHLLLSQSSCSKRKMRIHLDISVSYCLSDHLTEQWTESALGSSCVRHGHHQEAGSEALCRSAWSSQGTLVPPEPSPATSPTPAPAPPQSV